MFVIDFHSHILPGIDDGSADIEVSEQMLQMSVDQGVNVQVLTPHFYATKMNIDSFLIKRDTALKELIPVARRNKIHIRVGAEVAFFNNMSQSEHLDKFLINNSRVLLIEMPFRQWTTRDVKEIEEIMRRGIIPLIAHLDRYISYQKDMEPMETLLSLKLISQINCEAFDSYFGRKKLFKTLGNHPFVLGSDAHNISNRVPNIDDGRSMVYSKLGKNTLKNIDKLGNTILGYNQIKK